MTPEDIDNRFAFHPATTEDKKNAHDGVRNNCRRLAHYLNDTVKDGREKSLAITSLEEVMFWGNAALARTDTKE